MFSPLPPVLLMLAAVGLALSLATGGLLQPDWALAVLLAALLARHSLWPWILPALLVHDLALYWTPWGVFPLACLLPAIVLSLDDQIGPGLPQRMGMLLIVSLPMLQYGSGVMQWVLTLLLCAPLWHVLARIYDRQYA
ncbi:MAG: hypothetical protein COS82_08325 [Zetaproteobacteria bacterium CG06_land_8_20_14_3_00_59_53]|nr:MAG: hypothetical protein AUK36_07420 [Zetaproteobacteria bacterium CG2_30_59_37]PIO88789.1 MAG: hypothetical protein COX56_11035 [Zetaproteobacteria bacterium CG23_combo_of_CG06-09_8_20_14_all_59_86]PIQ64512.1 MAG: hypothetical protein COV97_08725 [Zetaproteobacteria bacterium CG11_big_fil_rev_8_21_14_0_20_59_439]PIU70020.1 MAG: hypothetical protein COS82_08325 [Zetaproteobacteria bacterium CG06_land_8_20_14_3_00_59_53]PIU97977.1 MAG: hypothetical protein COS62_00770 [Zetaproteobacteria bac